MPVTQPIPIAVVMTSFAAGGTERQMIELVRRLDRTRWQVHVACMNAEGPWRSRVMEVAPIAEFPVTGFRRPDTCRQALAFARWCSNHRIEVVHTIDYYSNVFGLPAAAFARVPVRIGSRRGLNVDRSAGQLAMQRAAYHCAHAIVANSRAVANHLGAERIATSKITVVPNGLDLDAFRACEPRAARRRVVVVANLRPEKGHDVLVDAAVQVLKQYPDATFDLVGSGGQREAIQARIDGQGITHAFNFLGERDDVPALLAAADLFVLPSRTESLPNSVLEAMAAALPVVASAVGGIPEMIDDGRTGLLTPSGDATALAERLMQVMANATFATRLGQAARTEVHARYSFDRMITSMEALYLRELAKRGRVRAEMAA